MKKAIIAGLCLIASTCAVKAIPLFNANWIQNNYAYDLNFQINGLIHDPDIDSWKVFVNDVLVEEVHGAFENTGFSGTLPLNFQPAYMLALGSHTVRFEYTDDGITYTDLPTDSYIVTQPTGHFPIPDSGSALALVAIAIGSFGMFSRR